MIYLAADHRGFRLKEILKRFLSEELHLPLVDVGAHEQDLYDDYVDFAESALDVMAKDPANHKGIFICGSGHGMDMVANKYKGIRAALGFNADVARQSREHENTNVLVLPSDWLNEDEAKKIVKVWLESEFSGVDRHIRRVDKISAVEEENFK
ncbi:RpiB/LacA/LacB family sugar-phosphate isomerase [Patescibacteria group bacterium]|nr:RpiB/LacA/LacB family sugar-phosphate isomerase [Patescibacteria group bacterium]